MDIGRLNVRIDKVEEDLIIEKGKIKQVSDELNGLFNSMMDDGYQLTSKYLLTVKKKLKD